MVKTNHPHRPGYILHFNNGKEYSCVNFEAFMSTAPEFVKKYSFMGWEAYDGKEIHRAVTFEELEKMLIELNPE